MNETPPADGPATENKTETPPPAVAADNSDNTNSPHSVVLGGVIGVVLLSAAVVLFSSYTHWSIYAVAGVLALIGVLLVAGVLFAETPPEGASPIRSFTEPLLIIVFLVTALPRLKPYIKSDLLFIGIVVAALLVLVVRRDYRRTLIQSLVLVFCCYTAVVFFQNRQDLRRGLQTKTETFKEASKKFVSFKYIRDALKLKDQVSTLRLAPYMAAIDSELPKIKTQAASLASGIPHTRQQDVIYAIFKWVTENVEYRKDPDGSWGNGDYIQPPLQTIESLAGDCDDSSILLASLLESLGIKTYLIFIPRHVFVLVEPEPNTLTERLGKPVGKIEGRPVFALESTRDTPTMGAPSDFSALKDSEITVIRSSTKRTASLER